MKLWDVYDGQFPGNQIYRVSQGAWNMFDIPPGFLRKKPDRIGYVDDDSLYVLLDHEENHVMVMNDKGVIGWISKSCFDEDDLLIE